MILRYAILITALASIALGSIAQETVGQRDPADEKTLQPDDVLSASERRPPYDPRDKRDPFKPFIRTTKPGPTPTPKSVIDFPIKRYALKDFRLVGIMWIGDVPKAMVVDPAKNTYFLTLGDEIGNNNGRILEIRDHGVLIQEKTIYEDMFGVKKEKINNIILAFIEK